MKSRRSGRCSSPFDMAQVLTMQAPRACDFAGSFGNSAEVAPASPPKECRRGRRSCPEHAQRSPAAVYFAACFALCRLLGAAAAAFVPSSGGGLAASADDDIGVHDVAALAFLP